MLAALSQVAGHLLAVLMWADTPQRAAVVAVAVLAVAAVAVVGCLAAGASPPRRQAFPSPAASPRCGTSRGASPSCGSATPTRGAEADPELQRRPQAAA